MNEQEKANILSTQIDQLLHLSAQQTADEQLTDDDQALLDLAQQMASLDFSKQSRFLQQRRQQPQGAKNIMSTFTNGRRPLIALGATLLLLIVALVLIAPVRTFAQELWQSLFVRHEGSVMTVEPYNLETDPTPTPIPAPESVPDLTVTEADALASFSVKELTQLPQGFALSSVYYDEERDKVTFLYLNEANLGIVLHQEPAVTAEPWIIGADAVIEAVTVNDVPGEYVQGSWQWGESTVEGAIGTTEVWKSDDPHQQLRWTADGITYTVSTTVGQDLGLTQADLIAIAASLQ